MVRPPSAARMSIYCYLLLLGTLLFQLRFMPPVAEYEVHASHIQTIFFLAVALLLRGSTTLLFSFDKNLFAICLLFYFLALVSTSNSIDAVASYTRWYCYFSSFLLALGLMLALRAGLMSVAGIVSVILCACIIIVLAEARDIAQEWQLYREMNKRFLWMPLYFNQIRNFAHVPFAGLLMSVWLLSASTGGWRRPVGFLLSLVFMVALLWTGGRAPLLMLPICALVLSYLLPAALAKRTLWVWLLSAMIGYSFLHVSDNDFMLQRGLDRFDYDLRVVAGINTQENVQADKLSLPPKVYNNLGSGRGKHWRRGLQLWFEHPILGNGSDAFFITSGNTFLHPHNWVVRCLLEFGAVGLLLVSVAIAKLLWHGKKIILTNRDSSVLLTVAYTQIVAWLGYGSLSGNLYFSWSLAVFAIAIAIVCDAIGRQYGSTQIKAVNKSGSGQKNSRITIPVRVA